MANQLHVKAMVGWLTSIIAYGFYLLLRSASDHGSKISHLDKDTYRLHVTFHFNRTSMAKHTSILCMQLRGSTLALVENPNCTTDVSRTYIHGVVIFVGEVGQS